MKHILFGGLTKRIRFQTYGLDTTYSIRGRYMSSRNKTHILAIL